VILRVSGDIRKLKNQYMLKYLLLPLSIYRLKIKMLLLQLHIKKMEKARYLNLWDRIQLAKFKKVLTVLHEQELAILQTGLILSGTGENA